jgi:peptidyl-prolyl cis-trans isomerase D
MIRFLQSGNKAAKYILGGFLLVLAASMVTYLIPGFMNDTAVTRGGVIASVAGQDISTAQVQKAFQQQMQGRQANPDMMAFYQQFMMPQITRQLIQRAEVVYEANRLGLRVSDEEVRDEMQNGAMKQYFFPDGKWIGQQQYEELLRQNGQTPDDFERDMRDSLLSRKLFYTVGASVSVAPSDIEKAYKDKNTKVKFQYAILDLAEITKQIKPTDAELKAFYDTNKARYQNSIPEKRQVRYFVLSDKDAEAKATADNAEVARYYNEHQNEFHLPERVRVRHILIKTPPPGADGKVDQKAVDEARKKAADILKQVKAGGDFAELARKNSQDPGSADKGGELGWIVKGQTVPEFEKTAFAQSPGQISDLVQSSYGFHIIQTEEKDTDRVKPLSEVRAGIENVIKGQKASALINQNSTMAQDIMQKQGLDKAAAKFGAQVVESNPIARTDTLPGIGPAPELMSLIFATDPKSAPQIARTQQGYVAFQVTKFTPAATPSFEEIKDKVATDFKNQRANELLQKRAKELSDRAHAEHDLAKAAKEVGATVKTSELVSRTSQVPDIGSMAGPASAVFTLKPGEISGPLNLGAKMAVAAVTDKQEPSASDADFAKQKDQLAEQLSQQKREEALGIFLNNLDERLKKEGKLKINNAEMNALTKTRG